MRRYLIPVLVLAILLLAGLACSRQPASPVIIVTATAEQPVGITTRQADDAPVVLPTEAPQIPSGELIQPTLDPVRGGTPEPLPDTYVVQNGDNLSSIAVRFGTSIEALAAANDILDPSLLAVGQVLDLPDTTAVYSPAFKIIPDSEVVRGPRTANFDLRAYVGGLPGYLRTYTERVGDEQLDGVQVVQRVVDEFSVNPRLLLALLEFRAGWLLVSSPSEATLLYPMGYQQLGYEGLYKQLSWMANRLNEAYYGWRLRGQLWFGFDGGVRVLYAPGLNAGTVAVQYALSRNQEYGRWQYEVGQGGFYALYVSLFGDPFSFAVEPLLPPDLTQPEMQFPWAQGETWYYTGGPHGAFGVGSAWSAVDFAPPGDENTAGCFIAPQWTTAVADGVIARTGNGFVVLDLDGDGDETTGWTVVYLHVATEGRVAEGATVRTGDRLGHPSCEGGVSTATHLHIGRRYNGEWISAHCHNCAPGIPNLPFVMSGWTVQGWESQEYQGYMVDGEEYRQAEQGRDNPLNQLSW